MYIILFTLGIAFRTFYNLGNAFIFFLILLSFVFLAYRFITRKAFFMQISIVLLFFAFGIFWMGTYVENAYAHMSDFYEGQKVSTVGVVSDYPDARIKNTLLHIAIKDTNKELLAFTDPYTEYNYGDVVSVDGIIKRPTKFSSEDGRVFDYEGYLKKDGIFFLLRYPKIQILESRQEGNAVLKTLFWFKEKYLQAIGNYIPDPESALAAGITVGDKQSLGEKLKQDFRIAGIIHIVVLSGYNISIIAMAIFALLAFLPRYSMITYVVGAVPVILFALLTGGGATIVRAAGMGLLSMLALQLGRKYNIMRALFAVGLLMLLWNPFILIHDISFQLSFIATLGIIGIYPILFEKLIFVSEKYHIRDVVAGTLAAQISVLPLIVYYMGDISFVALPVNILVVPLVPFAMLFVFLTGVFGILGVSFLASIFGVVSYGLLHIIFTIVDIFVAIPHASVHVSVLSFWWVVLGYMVILIWYFNNRQLKKELPLRII